MILIDTNYFLRALVTPSPKTDPRLFASASRLFTLARDGALDFTTSEAVISEAVWAMVKIYGLPRHEVAIGMIDLLELPSCRMPSRRLCVDALRAWAITPSISFVDAIIALDAARSGYQLATLDEALARFASAPVWDPEKRES